MDRLRQYIREQIIKEIGEGTTPYPFTFKGAEPKSPFNKNMVAGYKINGPVPISVAISPYGTPLTPILRIEFYVIAGKDKLGIVLSSEPTNLGLEVMFRILTTIKEIVKDYLERFDFSVKAIEYTASAEKMGGLFSTKKAQQRNKLYLAYIKNIFPDAVVKSDFSSGWEENPEDDIKTFIEFRKLVTHKDIK
jgi:hypothetical protein